MVAERSRGARGTFAATVPASIGRQAAQKRAQGAAEAIVALRLASPVLAQRRRPGGPILALAAKAAGLAAAMAEPGRGAAGLDLDRQRVVFVSAITPGAGVRGARPAGSGA